MKRLLTIFVSASAILTLLSDFSMGQDRGDRGDRRDRGGFGGDSGRGDRGGFGGAPSGMGGPPSGFGGGGFGGPPGSFGGGGFGGPPGGFSGGFGGPPGGFSGGFGGPPGGFSGGDRESRFGSMMDSNGNGKVDQEEIDRMPTFVRDMMKARGVELKAGMSLDDMRNSFRSNFSQGSNGQNGQPNDPNRNSGTGAVVLTPYKMKPKKPLTITLPPAYSEVDTDFDGQIAMHEWMLTRRVDLEQFDSMDIDSDGYLIPEELAMADAAAAASQSEVVSTAKKRLLIVNATPTRAKATSNNGQPGSGPPGSTPQNPQDYGNRGGWGGGDPAAMASESFRRLDGNGDGFIDTEEWQNSRRTRGMFEQAGIRLEKMSLEQFSQHYVRLMSNGGGR
jgi:hypothetical protein